MCDSFSPLWLPFLGVSLMKLWHSIHQKTSSLSTTRSLSSSSSARTTEWVKQACWEPAGQCVWACVCLALYCEECIHSISSVPLHLCSKQACLSPLFTASVPPLPGVGMWGRRLPLCSALSRTRPPRGSDRWSPGAAHAERRPHLHPAWAVMLI